MMISNDRQACKVHDGYPRQRTESEKRKLREPLSQMQQSQGRERMIGPKRGWQGSRTK